MSRAKWFDCNGVEPTDGDVIRHVNSDERVNGQRWLKEYEKVV